MEEVLQFFQNLWSNFSVWAGIGTGAISLTTVCIIAKVVLPKILAAIGTKDDVTSVVNDSLESITKQQAEKDAVTQEELQIQSQKMDALYNLLVGIASNSSIQQAGIASIAELATQYKNIGVETLDKSATTIINSGTDLLNELANQANAAQKEAKEVTENKTLLEMIAEKAAQTSTENKEGA